MSGAVGSPGFPTIRMRRLRRTPALRALLADTTLSVSDLILPVFVREGADRPRPIDALPGVQQHDLRSLVVQAKELVRLGVPAMMLFGVPERKDAVGSGASDPNGIVQVALREVRDAVGDGLVLFADLCLDEYTDHGHCGLLTDNGVVDNDRTIEVYGEIARVQAQAGADVVAPSGMMDGQVAAIRSALDDGGFFDTAILAYAAKFASSFYGPFREAVDVTIVRGGDRLSYQQDFRNRHEAVREVELDVSEGADMVMVKPALAYLDVIAKVRKRFELPVAAYQVSGEYSMICAAAERGWIDRDAAMMESLIAIKRAGAGQILTYFAEEIAEHLSS